MYNIVWTNLAILHNYDHDHTHHMFDPDHEQILRFQVQNLPRAPKQHFEENFTIPFVTVITQWYLFSKKNFNKHIGIVLGIFHHPIFHHEKSTFLHKNFSSELDLICYLQFWRVSFIRWIFETCCKIMKGFVLVSCFLALYVSVDFRFSPLGP